MSFDSGYWWRSGLSACTCVGVSEEAQASKIPEDKSYTKTSRLRLGCVSGEFWHKSQEALKTVERKGR
jgi:hypothetical protein